AHGGVRYDLRYDATTVKEIVEQSGLTEADAGTKLVSLLEHADLTAIEESGLIKDLAKKTKLEVRPVTQAIREKRQNGRGRHENCHADNGCDARARPAIQVAKGELDTIADACEAALIASGLPVFQRGRDLVRPATWEVSASNNRKTLATGIITITSVGM